MGFVAIDNTNLENGVTNRNAADMFGSMAQLDPTRFHSYMEDFDYYTAADWTITGAGAGTQALANVNGGILRLTTAGADDDAEFLSKVGNGFSPEASLRAFFRGRLSVDDAVDSELVVGLANAGGLLPDNGVVFVKADGAATVDVLIRSGAATVASATAIATITTAQTTYEWMWDGIDRIYYGINGSPLGFLDASTLPVGNLSPSVGVQAGQAAALVGDVDYLFAAQERG